jgi:hypothetical protein
MAIAQDAFGKESEEWKKANAALVMPPGKNPPNTRSGKRMKSRQDEPIIISKNATVADLFKAIEAFEEKTELSASHFEDELHDNFNTEVVRASFGYARYARKRRRSQRC